MSPTFERIVVCFLRNQRANAVELLTKGMFIQKSVDWSIVHLLFSSLSLLVLCPISGEYYLNVRFHHTCCLLLIPDLRGLFLNQRIFEIFYKMRSSQMLKLIGATFKRSFK